MTFRLKTLKLEILNVRGLEYSSPSSTRSTLVNDQAIKWAGRRSSQACITAVMQGRSDLHRDGLPLVPKHRAQSLPSPPCGARAAVSHGQPREETLNQWKRGRERGGPLLPEDREMPMHMTTCLPCTAAMFRNMAQERVRRSMRGHLKRARPYTWWSFGHAGGRHAGRRGGVASFPTTRSAVGADDVTIISNFSASRWPK